VKGVWWERVGQKVDVGALERFDSFSEMVF
jgi:hypothetical protein